MLRSAGTLSVGPSSSPSDGATVCRVIEGESAERVNRVLNAAQGPFLTRGRQRFLYDEAKWYAALAIMPELSDDERRLVVALLTRTKRKHEQDAAWLRGSAYAAVLAALAAALQHLEGVWLALALGVLAGLSTYVQGKVAQSHEPAIGHAEGLLAALAETPRATGPQST